jgi:hypothetical protein
MCRETTNSDKLSQRFKATFTFEHEYLVVSVELKVIQTNIFLEEGLMEVVPV